ncbi:hypothetical protein SH1V18_11870 [Vallitalea longa]|uniref:Uncharacterized protein n=1 Tax=Vallitalea longa TaxID=2936439 RepID=A0A9W5Y8E4_9FIRM|nr:hypothetical protein [Vallitalea longa]GKX28707.1 hypothetical protein SH1V18_11870 [Vallitalea longa]
MKDFIVLIAVLILLLPFPLQYALEEYNHNQKSEIQSYVFTAKEKAKQEGYFTEKIKKQLIESITQNLNIKENDISIITDNKRKYRESKFNKDNLIHYKIEVPIKKVIAVPIIWGISDEENQTVYTIEGYAASEAIS